MKDIIIKVSQATRMVDVIKGTIGNDGENLQGNIIFEFKDGFVDGIGRLEYRIEGIDYYVMLEKVEETYQVPIKSVMTKYGQIDMQLVVTENGEDIPVFKSNVFFVYCNKSINAEIEQPNEYLSWIEVANSKLNEIDSAVEETNKQSAYAKQQGDYAKIEGDNAKSVAEETEKKAQEGAFDGKSLEFVWQGTKLGVRLEGQEAYQFVDLQGVQGEIGATGEPFKIKKTYASVSEMNADFRNMEFGDYVMIASSVEVEDNAKLYTRGESAWIFISDFSGAMGIRGETGLTPNIKIGEVKTLEAGSQAKVTRSGSNEEPVFNFELPKGDKGDDYVLTEEDKVEIGEKVNTEYEERIAENEKYISELEATIDILTYTDTKRGELVHITDALNLPTFKNVIDGNVKQEGEPSPTSPQEIEVIEGDLSYKVNGKNLFDENEFYKSNFNNVVKVENGYNFDVIKSQNVYTLGKVKPNTPYTFKGKIIGTTGANLSMTVEYTDGTKKYAYETFGDNSFKITTDGTKTLKSITFAFYNQGNFKNYTFEEVMLSEYDDEYEPYQEQIVPLDLKGNWVGAINDNIKDYLVTDKKKYWLVKNVGKVVLDGSEDIYRVETKTTGIYRFKVVTRLRNIIKIDNASTISVLLSNRFYGVSRDNTWSLKQGIAYGNSSNNYGDFVIYSDVTKEMTAEEIKQWLSENNVEIYYQLAEPQIIELGKLPEPIKTFEGTNNIQVLANLDTEIEVKYALDLKKYYDNKLAEISAQII